MFPPRLRKNQIALAALLVLSVLVLTLHYRMGEESVFASAQRAAIGVLAPLQSGMAAVTRPIRNGVQYVTEFGGLKRENARLKEEVRELRQDVVTLREQKAENRRLRKLVGFEDRALDTVPARIIGRSPNNWQDTVAIDKGSSEGVRLRMPVVSGEGLVGQVIKVSGHAAEVQLVIDSRSGVGARVQKTGEKGIAQGELGRRVSLDFIPKEAKLERGQEIVTSGLGGIFPKGILIGFVSKAQIRPYSMYKEIEIRPAVRFSRLEEALVITNPSPDVPWEED